MNFIGDLDATVDRPIAALGPRGGRLPTGNIISRCMVKNYRTRVKCLAHLLTVRGLPHSVKKLKTPR
jgi:hypothetical protein